MIRLCLDLDGETSHLSGIKKSKTAFSCTCHPKRKEVKADKVSAFRKRLYVGSNHSLVI